MMKGDSYSGEYSDCNRDCIRSAGHKPRHTLCSRNLKTIMPSGRTPKRSSRNINQHSERFYYKFLTPLSLILFWYCVCSFDVTGVGGFNLDVNFPTMVTIPEKRSYFGYSVDMYASQQQSWLLVGAPKSRDRGEVYQCQYADGNATDCVLVNYIKDSSATRAVKDMFGMTLKVGQGKQLLACAPYFTLKTENDAGAEKYVYYDIVGICYLAEDFTAEELDVFRLIPCQSAKGRYHDGDEHGSCQAGLSAAFTKDGNNIVLGTAGSFYRQGAIMRIPLPLSNDVTLLPVHTGENKPVVPEGWGDSDWIMQSFDDNYLGYTVATGKSIGNSQLLFASAPRRFGYDLLGMVVVYDDEMAYALYNFTGTQTGEYFGCGLAAVDLNNDNLDDVIVGAPLYSNFDRKLVENGRMYIFYQNKAETDPVDGTTLLSFSAPVIIEGEGQRSRFGHVISSIGDVNQDGYDDVAVGAPYSTNDGDSGNIDGSVFIFNGGPEGLNLPASQEIKGMHLHKSASGFGISISGEKDVDRNGYPDIFSGAYMSDQAFLLRARPVVQVESVVSVNPQVIEIEAKSCPRKNSVVSCFEMQTCFSYSGKSLPPSIVLTYKYNIDTAKSGDEKRAYVLNESPRNVTLIRETTGQSVKKCVKELAYLNVDIRDKVSDIDLSVSYDLVERNQPVEPILNQLSPTEAEARVKIFKDCGADDICQADLVIKSEIDLDTVYVGADYLIVLKEVVRNMGESAFLATLVVEFPEHVDYVGTQDKDTATGLVRYCSNIDRFVTCELGNPMKREEVADVNLKFLVSGLTGNVSTLIFKSFVNSTNPVNSTSLTTTSAVKIEVKSNIAVYNSTSPETIFLDDVKEMEEKKKQTRGNVTQVIHTYELINNGPSDIETATILISWPLLTQEGTELMGVREIVVKTGKATVVCESPTVTSNDGEVDLQINGSTDANYYHCDKGIECSTIPCAVTSFPRQDDLTVAVHASLPLSVVLKNELDSYIRSEFEFRIDSYPYVINPGTGPTFRSEITTKCLYIREPEAKEIQWWIIAIAVASGVLVLCLLVFALWRCGFFERKRKPVGEDMSDREKLNPDQKDVGEEESEMESYLK